MSRRKGAAPATAGAVPAVLAAEILELRESAAMHAMCIRRDYAQQDRLVRELGRYWTQQRIADLLGVTESRINQVIRKVRNMEEAKEHTASFPYKAGDDTVNADLIEHMRTDDVKHQDLHARWVDGKTIGDIGDLHEIAHGFLSSEPELVAALEADARDERRGVCPSCQRAYVLVGLQRTTVRRHFEKGTAVVCDGAGATVVPGEGVVS